MALTSSVSGGLEPLLIIGRALPTAPFVKHFRCHCITYTTSSLISSTYYRGEYYSNRPRLYSHSIKFFFDNGGRRSGHFCYRGGISVCNGATAAFGKCDHGRYRYSIPINGKEYQQQHLDQHYWCHCCQLYNACDDCCKVLQGVKHLL